MRRNYLILILALIILAFPVFLFFINVFRILYIYIMFTNQRWTVNRFGNLIVEYLRGGYSYGGESFNSLLLVVSAFLTVIFFICLALFLKERKKIKAEKKKREVITASYIT